MRVRSFPQGFVWGVGSASYQVEGAVTEDGRLPSIWDTFTHTPGHVDNGDDGDTACDHYHRWPADLDLIASLGLASYRFSVAWPRIQPDGRAVNEKGLDFYRRLVDGLLERGVAPVMTLYHWDLPQALEDRGGWRSRDIADHFTDFALVLGKELGDRVPVITTLNEPWCTAFLGHSTGEHAPGQRDDATSLRVAHHLNLAHGRAASALRGVVPAEVALSVTLNLQQVFSASDAPEDLAAARHADAVANRIFLDPMLRGHYPPELIEDTAHLTDWSFVHDGDAREAMAPIDFLGVNYYSPNLVAVGPAGPDDKPWPGTDLIHQVEQDGPHTVMGWAIRPSALTDLLVRVHDDYAVPIIITENGIACDDVVDGAGMVHDPDRIDYLHDHLAAALDAIDAGVDLRGYFAWTLLDNFEWSWGYDKRFGMVHVDFVDQTRTVKDSAHWYAGVVARNALSDASPGRD